MHRRPSPAGVHDRGTLQRPTTSGSVLRTVDDAVLHVIDTAAKFGAARVLKEERDTDVVRALERAWTSLTDHGSACSLARHVVSASMQ